MKRRPPLLHHIYTLRVLLHWFLDYPTKIQYADNRIEKATIKQLEPEMRTLEAEPRAQAIKCTSISNVAIAIDNYVDNHGIQKANGLTKLFLL